MESSNYELIRNCAANGYILPGGTIPELVDEILRLRTEVETLRDVSRRVLNVGHNNDCLFCGFKDRTASEALHNEKEKQ